MIILARTPFLRFRSGGAVGTTWNPADKSANVVLSSGNLVCAQSGAALAGGVRSTTSKVASTGKWYAELTLSSIDNATTGGSGQDLAFGAGTATANLSLAGITSSGVALFAEDHWFTENAVDGTFASGVVPSAPCTCNIAIDTATGKIWLGINGTYLNGADGASTGNPVAGTNQTATVSGTLFLIASPRSTLTTFTLNPSPASPPSGFTAWG